jgi:hypothetical protein
VCLFSALSGFSQSNIRINEKQAKAYFEANERQNTRKLQIVLPFENAPRNAAINVKLEILSVTDAVLAQIETTQKLSGGKQSVKIPLALDRSSSDSIYFKVSRYELPQFSVAAKPDKTFYLPGESTAEITVSADYLFGKPVAKGTVKIVREKERRWNYKRQNGTLKRKTRRRAKPARTENSGRNLI